MSHSFRGETLKLVINDHMQGEGERNREKENEKESRGIPTSMDKGKIRLKNQHAC